MHNRAADEGDTHIMLAASTLVVFMAYARQHGLICAYHTKLMKLDCRLLPNEVMIKALACCDACQYQAEQATAGHVLNGPRLSGHLARNQSQSSPLDLK